MVFILGHSVAVRLASQFRTCLLRLATLAATLCGGLAYGVVSADALVISREDFMSLTTPENDCDIYALAVLSVYIELPHTPTRASPLDEAWARRFYERGIPFSVMETALLLGSVRRGTRSADAPPLPGIRSLAYFQPIIEELLRTPVPDSWRASLRIKMQRLCGQDQIAKPSQPVGP